VTDVHLYADYWASVLGMPGIVREEVLQRGLVDLDVFRSCLNRPRTRLPGLGYYLLMLFAGPVLIPYRMVQRIASRLHVPLAGEEAAEELLAPYRLQVQRDSGKARVHWRGECLAEGLVDPLQPEVVFSMVYPAYKILIAAVLAIGLSLLTHLFTDRPEMPERLGQLLLLANFPVLAVLLYAIFRDWWTSIVAPLPVFIVLWVVALLSPVRALPLGSFPALLAGLAVGYFVVDAFLVPRATAPTLYLYVNDPASPLFPYARGQAPYWLQGRTYWVWRFVMLARAEVHKFWEGDWERIEVWVRADGDTAGMIEWVVDDFHFRELWIPHERTASSREVTEQRRVIHEALRAAAPAGTWVVEVDTDLLGHWPELRGVFLLPPRQGWRQARLRQLARSLRVEVEADRPRDFRDVVHRLRLDRRDFLEDIPEYLRWLALRRLLSIPWRYWRFPRGANTTARPLLYGDGSDISGPRASEPSLQFKAPGFSLHPVAARAQRASSTPAGVETSKTPDPLADPPRVTSPDAEPGAGSGVGR
jgi:hypothetical protein